MGMACRVWGGVLMRWGNLRERGHFEERSVEGDNIKMDLQEMR